MPYSAIFQFSEFHCRVEQVVFFVFLFRSTKHLTFAVNFQVFLKEMLDFRWAILACDLWSHHTVSLLHNKHLPLTDGTYMYISLKLANQRLLSTLCKLYLEPWGTMRLKYWHTRWVKGTEGCLWHRNVQKQSSLSVLMQTLFYYKVRLSGCLHVLRTYDYFQTLE